MQSFKFISFLVFEKNRGQGEEDKLTPSPPLGRMTPSPQDARLNRVKGISNFEMLEK